MRVNWRVISSQRNSFATLYAACQQHGYLLNEVKKPESDVTLYSLNSIQAPALLDEMRSAPCITIAGGPHATALYQDLTGFADYVVVGEGEFTVPRLLHAIETGNPPPPGVATGERYTPVDHTVLPDGYPSFTEYKGYIEITRGCPFGCAYCQTPCIFGHQMRHRSLDSVKTLAQSYGQIRLVTPNALAYGSNGRTPRLEKVERLLKTLKNELNREIYFGTFPSEIRPEFVTAESVSLITRFCDNTRLHIGAQSGCDDVLSRLHRGHTSDDVYNAIDYCVDGGLTPIVDVILGFPDETEEEQAETIRLVREVCRRGYIHAHRFIPLPGTPLAGTQSSQVIPDAMVALGSLALTGRVTGSWNKPELRFFRTVSH
ncbi:MAG TPA: TIGR04013 family B12-binding domain/radical SAM domain-containing protein [Methanospirillum sp.]|nr:TIGR04013 family B12-binding domain/radical SAM domain-containing protein [Methanospirillum sp.]